MFMNLMQRNTVSDCEGLVLLMLWVGCQKKKARSARSHGAPERGNCKTVSNAGLVALPSCLQALLVTCTFHTD